MSKTPKKFLDENGVTYLASLLNNYPDNELLGTVIDAIDQAKADRVDLANVATSGNYNDLINRPVIAGASEIVSRDSTGSVIANINDTDIYIADATEERSGLMTAQDKQVLNSMNPNVTITVANNTTSEIFISNAKNMEALDLVIKAEPIIESQIRTNNLLNIHGETTPGFYISGTGSLSNNANDIVGDFIPVSPGDDIYYTGIIGPTNSSSINRRLHVYNANKTWIKQLNFAGNLKEGDNWSTHGVVPDNGAYVRVSWGVNDTRVMISIGAPTQYNPYYITPFSKITSTTFYIANNTEHTNPITYTVNVPTEAGDVYGFKYNPVVGKLYTTVGHISEYNGETLPGKWWSDRDVYVEGSTPSIGAEVIYVLNDEDVQEYNFTPVIPTLFYRDNAIYVNNGTVSSITYYGETFAIKHLTIYNGVTFGDTNINETDVQNWQRAANNFDTKADLNSPIFTGTPTAPNPSISDYSARIATTNFVQKQMANLAFNETTNKASNNYSIGEYIYFRGEFCKVTTTIAKGTILVVGTNLEKTTIGEQLKLLMDAVFTS